MIWSNSKWPRTSGSLGIASSPRQIELFLVDLFIQTPEIEISYQMHNVIDRIVHMWGFALRLRTRNYRNIDGPIFDERLHRPSTSRQPLGLTISNDNNTTSFKRKDNNSRKSQINVVVMNGKLFRRQLERLPAELQSRIGNFVIANNKAAAFSTRCNGIKTVDIPLFFWSATQVNFTQKRRYDTAFPLGVCCV